MRIRNPLSVVAGFFRSKQATGGNNVTTHGQTGWAPHAGNGVSGATTPERALTYSALYAGVRVISESMATLPLLAYQMDDDGGRKRLPRTDELAKLIRKPNAWMTTGEWIELMTAWAVMRGNGYSLIVRDANGKPDSLIPLDPATMLVSRNAEGRLYEYTWQNGQVVKYAQSDVFHLMGPSFDGVVGMSVVSLAAKTINIGLAAENLAAKQFTGKPLMSGVLTMDGTLTPEGAQRVAASFRNAHSGENALGVAVLEEGLTWMNTGISNVDAEFLNTRKFEITEVARWLRIPPHKIADHVASTFSNIESESVSFVRDSLSSWARRWEQAFQRDLVVMDDQFVEFLFESLLRGETTVRFAAYTQGITSGFLTRNEVRRFENLEPLPGLDEPLTPLNMTSDPNGSGDAAATTSAVIPTPEVNERLAFMLHTAASRLVRREVTAIKRWAKRDLSGAEWCAWVRKHYADTVDIIQDNLGANVLDATDYCVAAAGELESIGPTRALENVDNPEWTAAKVASLVSLIGDQPDVQ